MLIKFCIAPYLVDNEMKTSCIYLKKKKKNAAQDHKDWKALQVLFALPGSGGIGN